MTSPITATVQFTKAAMREPRQITGLVDRMKELRAILKADLRKVAR